MIPKIIHYIWLGNSAIPEAMQRCIDSWYKNMPDYVIKCWNEDSISEFDSLFVQEALQEKKYAFASDVIRLYILYKYGGIYLDTDVFVYRPFDDLLNCHSFIGKEGSMHQIGHTMENYLTTCCIGSEKGNSFIGKCLEYYENRHFIMSFNIALPIQLRLDMRLNSEVLCVLAKTIGYNSSLLANNIQQCDGGVLTIFPSDYFEAEHRTNKTYCKHLALGTWRVSYNRDFSYSWQYKIEWRIRRVVERILLKFNYVMVKLK